jgi:hypothetical protein
MVVNELIIIIGDGRMMCLFLNSLGNIYFGSLFDEKNGNNEVNS